MVRYFLTYIKFASNQLSDAGYRKFCPTASNQTSKGRTQNRRVDIVILIPKEKESEPGGEGAKERAE